MAKTKGSGAERTLADCKPYLQTTYRPPLVADALNSSASSESSSSTEESALSSLASFEGKTLPSERLLLPSFLTKEIFSRREWNWFEKRKNQPTAPGEQEKWGRLDFIDAALTLFKGCELPTEASLNEPEQRVQLQTAYDADKGRGLKNIDALITAKNPKLPEELIFALKYCFSQDAPFINNHRYIVSLVLQFIPILISRHYQRNISMRGPSWKVEAEITDKGNGVLVTILGGMKSFMDANARNREGVEVYEGVDGCNAVDFSAQYQLVFDPESETTSARLVTFTITPKVDFVDKAMSSKTAAKFGFFAKSSLGKALSLAENEVRADEAKERKCESFKGSYIKFFKEILTLERELVVQMRQEKDVDEESVKARRQLDQGISTLEEMHYALAAYKERLEAMGESLPSEAEYLEFTC